MSSYIVSARKYRPTTFESVVGQEALTTTLKNAITSGKLAHAYLFCGPRGVGKTTCARIFAKTINCTNLRPDGEACGECESCKSFAEGRSLNVYELDAASNNSVEDIRSLCDQVQVLPQLGRYKVFIIDEVHMLSTSAFNAFLKTLEEPPAHAIFILATTEKHKILPTILSRCQIYDFNRMEVSDVVNHLKGVAEKEGISYEESALGMIARKADGGMRDALSIFDQVASFSEGNITYQKVIEDLNILDSDYYFSLVNQLLSKDITGAMLTLGEVISKGFDAGLLVSGLGAHFRDLLMASDSATLPLVEAADGERQRYAEQASRCKANFLYRAIKICTECEQGYRTARSKRLLVEISLIEIAQAVDDESAGLRPAKVLQPIFANAAAGAAVSASQTQIAASANPTVETRKNLPSAPQSVGTVSKENASSARPAVETPRQPEPKTSLARTATRISIKPLASAASQSAPVDAVPYAEQQEEMPVVAEPAVFQRESRAEEFEESELQHQWLRYALSLPKEQNALASRLKNMRVKPGDDFVVNVGVDNEQVAEQLSLAQSDLLAYLREELRNDRITLNVAIVEMAAPKRSFSRREQHEEMLRHSSSFALLCEEMQLELA